MHLLTASKYLQFINRYYKDSQSKVMRQKIDEDVKILVRILDKTIMYIVEKKQWVLETALEEVLSQVYLLIASHPHLFKTHITALDNILHRSVTLLPSPQVQAASLRISTQLIFNSSNYNEMVNNIL